MHTPTSLALTLGLLLAAIAPAAASPTSAIQMGSKHNLYLSTCTQRGTILDPGCPLLIFCDKQTSKKRQESIAARSFTAVAYFPNGPVDSSRPGTPPSSMATVTNPAQGWEGTQRVAKLGLGGRGSGNGAFSSNIAAGAAGLGKGEIAGEAKVDGEDFVCFRDGVTKFGYETDLGLEKVECVADYWCPSIQV